jgi:hypothetical protein
VDEEEEFFDLTNFSSFVQQFKPSQARTQIGVCRYCSESVLLIVLRSNFSVAVSAG